MKLKGRLKIILSSMIASKFYCDFRLRESHKMASQERRLMLQQQQHIAKMRVAARELTSKLQNKDAALKVRSY
jgi:hypothetical protein